MATPVKNIEKEYLLRVLYDEELPAVYLRDRVEHLLFLQRPARDELVFHSGRPIERLKRREQIELTFDFRGKAVAFTVEVIQAKGLEVTCSMPDFLYKDLDRTYSRVSMPSQMEVQFAFLGERYNLSFPKLAEYDAGDMGAFFQDSEPKNLSGLIEQMAVWIKKYASGYKLVIFKDVKPSTVEERVITETGKTLFLPSTRENFPESDPFPRRRIITAAIFKRYLESTGIGLGFVDSACARFVRAKADEGTLADAWIPILFREYVIGCIHVWNDVPGKAAFDYQMIDTLYQFTKVLTYSLKSKGYFEKGKVDNESFDGKVIDISASGLLFAYPPSDLSTSLRSENDLMIMITTPDRAITTGAVIVRRFKDKALGYYGCQFENMDTSDQNYLFEYIYGKPPSDADSEFLAGQM